jgi:hypothetical protein
LDQFALTIDEDNKSWRLRLPWFWRVI